MKQFQVPQFIMIEDKAIGGLLTIKQTAYLIGAGVLGFIAYGVFQGLILYIIWIFLGALSASLAWLKINGMPFPIVLKNFAFYLIKPRLYLWKQEKPKQPKPGVETKKQTALIITMPKLSESKLSDLAWSLDIKEKTRS